MEILQWWQVYDSRFEEHQRRKHDVRNRFLPWALVEETDWRNAANNWVDVKITGCKDKQVFE